MPHCANYFACQILRIRSVCPNKTRNEFNHAQCEGIKMHLAAPHIGAGGVAGSKLMQTTRPNYNWKSRKSAKEARRGKSRLTEAATASWVASRQCTKLWRRLAKLRQQQQDEAGDNTHTHTHTCCLWAVAATDRERERDRETLTRQTLCRRWRRGRKANNASNWHLIGLQISQEAQHAFSCKPQMMQCSRDKGGAEGEGVRGLSRRV